MTGQTIHWTKTAVQISFLLALITAFITGPAILIGPIDLILFDGAMVLLTLSLTLHIAQDPVLIIPKHRSLWAISTGYFALAFGLPVAGVILYNNPIGYFVGDIRWIQIFIVGLAAMVLYSQYISGLFYDLKLAMKIILVSHLIVFSLQFAAYNGLLSTEWLLEIWYFGQSAYGGHGYHTGRFAAASTTSAGLGLSAAIAIAIFGRSALIDRSDYMYLAVATMLLVASGHRTSIVAVIGIFGVYSAYRIRNVISLEVPARYIASGTAGLAVLLAIGYHFNVGRLATSDRYRVMIDVILSPSLFLEMSGRGDRWGPALTRAESYPMGTLSNPAWVFHDLDPIDSYFVLTYLQGELVFFVVFVLFLTTLSLVSLRLLAHSDHALLTISFTGIMVAFSLTQNFMTSTSGKALAVLSVVILLSICGSLNHQTVTNPAAEGY